MGVQERRIGSNPDTSEAPAVQYLDFLAQVHDLLKPRTYLEIGVRNGHSMALSSTRSIGIDPAYEIAEEVTIGPDATLYMETSDDFFAGEKPLAAFDEPLIDLAFIDGLHLYEFVLRDFMNVEKYAAPGSVIIFDDVLPRATVHAARDRETRTWTGDVWKIIPTLREVRPDLILLLVRTTPTGLLLVLGGDLTNTDLTTAYDRMLAEHVSSSQEPPAEIITRSTAVYPTWVVGAPFWEVLRSQRERSVTPAEGRAELLVSLQEWASTTLNDKQAKAIHPSLTGKPKAAKPAAKKAASSTRPASRPAPAVGGRVLNGVRWRLKKLVRVSKMAVAEYRKPAGS
jgi:predicted O-methyltransferase YrrM